MPSLTRSSSATARLANGGFIGALSAAGLAIVAAAILAGRPGVLSAAGAAGLVIIYFGAGQLVERFALRMADATGMTITLLGYVVRVGLLGLLLWASMSIPAIRETMVADWVATGAIAGVLGWLTGLLFAHSRSRVPVYDQPYEPPTGWEEQ